MVREPVGHAHSTERPWHPVSQQRARESLTQTASGDMFLDNQDRPGPRFQRSEQVGLGERAHLPQPDNSNIETVLPLEDLAGLDRLS
jgi:hypothetical protein